MTRVERQFGNRRTYGLSALLASACIVCAADWPTYRADAGRSGYTAGRVPESIALHWIHTPLHPPAPAWSGRDTRMPFDQAFHVAVADGRVFFGSSADGRLYALDGNTGNTLWSYPTEAPIRLAPSVWRDRVLVVSDDGFLYCLAVADGALLWRVRGGPMAGSVLGNGRLVSRWPARGGPVVSDSTVYWGAGIWPSEGIYLYATDIRSGKTLWCNDSSGDLFMPQPHRGANSRSGVSAQGFLLLSADTLLVPTGRAVPAALDPTDGRLRYFHLQAFGHAGGASLTATATQHLCPGYVFDTAKGMPGHRLPLDPDITAVTPTALVGVKMPDLLVLDPDKLIGVEPGQDRNGKPTTRVVMATPRRKMSCPVEMPCALIAAGDTLVVGGQDEVCTVAFESGKVLSRASVTGRALGLAVADEKLYVSTDRGAIYCLGAAGPEKPRLLNVQPALVSAKSDAVGSAADEIVRRSGITEGYCLDLECGDGDLACALAARTRLHIIAVDTDPAQVAKARAKAFAAGVEGVRVSVFECPPGQSFLPPYWANLIVSGRSLQAGAECVDLAEVRRVLRPYGGIACLGRAGAMQIEARGDLAGAGTWTHQYCDAANSNCSSDTLVRGPLGALWFTDLGFQVPNRHGRGPAPLFYKGLLYIQGLNGVRCVDAYNGRSVWEHDLPGILRMYNGEHLMGTSGTGSRFCVGESGVFVGSGSECRKLDRLTGSVTSTFSAPERPDGTSGTWGVLACADDTVVGTLADTDHIVTYRYGKADMSEQFTESTVVFALDAHTGNEEWRWQAAHSVRHNALAIGAGRVFLIDRPTAKVDKPIPKRSGAASPAAPHATGTLAALDLSTGRELWTVDEDVFGTLLALSVEHDTLVMGYLDWRFKLPSEIGGRLAAFVASTGEKRWDIKARYTTRPIIRGRTLYMQPGAWDLLSGRALDFEFHRAYGCGIPAASQNLMLFRSGTLGYVDLRHALGTENYGGIRPGCWINAVPAGGLVLMPDATDRCGCSYLVKASVALMPWGVRAPVIQPAACASRDPLTIRIASDDPTAVIRYTLDGTSPSEASPRYVEPISIERTTTVKSRAFAPRAPGGRVAVSEYVVGPTVIPIDAPEWRVADAPGGSAAGSKWVLDDDTVTERSNYFIGSATDPDPEMERRGTLRIYDREGPPADGEFRARLASADNDGIGLAFRVQGDDRYYLWAMDAQRSFHILARKVGPSYKVLAKNTKRYAINRWYSVRVVLRGPSIQVFLDGECDLSVTDSELGNGTFALYSWGSAGAKFRDVCWTPADSSTDVAE